MNSLITENEKFPYSEKELAGLAELEKITDDDIDFSDIPKITGEEWKKFKPARLRKKNLKVAG